MLLPLQVIIFGFTIWFGMYLLTRNPAKPALRFAGMGLIAYALNVGLDALNGVYSGSPPALWPSLFLPGLFWFGATIHILPDTLPNQARLSRLFNHAWLPLSVLLMLSAAINISWIGALIALVIALLLLTALLFSLRAYRLTDPDTRSYGIVALITLFFGLSMGLVILPTGWLSREVALLAIAVDLLLLGLVAAKLDAFDEGESLLPDFLRSFVYALFAATIFGGQMVMIIAISGLSVPLLALLLTIIASAIIMQTAADSLQALLDRFILAPRLRQERVELRAAVSATTRINNMLDLETLDEAEFTRLTRRALSHLGDLSHLAASPLTRLPIIDSRLAERGASDNTLERANELKALLSENIDRLKPRGKGDFGTADEWRHYNALYFPYVIGIKPYSRSYQNDDLEPSVQTALEWFQANIPERTLHNWQNASARLIAQDLRERVTADFWH